MKVSTIPGMRAARWPKWVAIAAALGGMSATSALNFTTLPPYLSESRGSPQVMINLSRDHQLFYKAYNEYSDLDGDGAPETTYLHAYPYYGYFDNQRCYLYDTAANRFNPSRKVNPTDRYCGNSGEWSGNFLNWASMTRMDVVRRILYGGKRVIDNGASDSPANLTVLERANLPTDAHSFAKYYAGSDISKLTPFAVAELTVCNRTPGGNAANRYSHTNANPPQILVAHGNHALWNANERWQCNWNEEHSTSNGNDPQVSGVNASSGNPSRSSAGLGRSGSDQGTYTARLSVCNPAQSSDFTDDEKMRCKQYPSGNFKPTGLLHRYGERNEAAFGLLTGSWAKNASGGVVRKNVGTFTDEVNIATDGRFIHPAGIVANIDKIVIYGYDYQDGTYISADNCSFQLIGLVEGNCTSWGNPIGEMFLEAIRYFAGKSPTPDFLPATGNGKEAAIGLTVANWTDPFRDSTVGLYGQKICRQINVVNFNASVTSYDGDQWGSASGLPFPGGSTIDSLTNAIGTSEGLYTGAAQWFVGDNGSGRSNSLCTAKPISALAAALGICPEAPAYHGSYKMGGAALFAHNYPIRTDIPIPSGNRKAFRVNSYSVALATGTPRIQVPVPGQAGKFVTIQPAYRLDLGTGGSGTLVDFKTIRQTPTEGKYLIQWEDSEQGGDYDMDVWGTLEYQVVGQQIRVSTYVGYDATNRPQGFGYIISGTADNQDGVHFHSGILGFAFTDPANISVTPRTAINASGGCSNCQSRQAKTTAQYSIVGTPADVLRDPLWYSAKYGGFDRSAVGYGYTPGTVLPAGSWDVKRTDGSRGADGIPDNYFYAINPAELERSLADIFNAILRSGGSAPAAAASSQTAANNAIYVSTYSIRPASDVADADASGQILRYGFGATGDPLTIPTWDAGAVLTAQHWSTGRTMLTSTLTGPRAFRWSNLDAGQQAALNRNIYGTTDSLGSRRLEWLRGSSGNETAPGTPSGFRQRPTTKLGAIVNSSPWLMGAPGAGYSASEYGGGYPAFRSANASRNTLFVGANDGMLHAIDAATGREQFTYIPRSVYPRLPALTAKDVSLNASAGYTTVDGSVMVADIQVGASWRSRLFGVLGRGGQGIYSLDVTDPGAITETAAASAAPWEFTDADDPDLGNIVGRTLTRPNAQPHQVAYMANDRWAALFGNGYNSDAVDGRAGTGRAALFILLAAGPTGPGATWIAGTDYLKIPTGAAGNGPGNGLGPPTPVDADNDGRADFVYAGDLKGNVWKFDVRDASPARWTVALSGAPLYTARTANDETQSITTAVVPVPNAAGGYQLVFGTGKLLEASDYPMAVPRTQTVYSLWDRPGNVAPLAAGRGRLAEQAPTASGTLRIAAPLDIQYARRDGWYMDLSMPSEMVAFNPSLLNLSQVAVRTIFPEATNDGCRVDSGAYTLVLDPVSGNPIPRSLDVNLDGRFNALDDVPASPSGNGSSRVAGLRQKNLFEFSTLKSPADPPCNSRLTTSGGDGTVASLRIAGQCLAGRLGWREVVRNR